MSVQRYGCEGETSRNCLHHAGRQHLSAHFLEEIARHKTFSAHFLEEIARHKLFSAHFLRKSAATKLFRLISSGNRPPQNCFGSFPQEIGRSLTHSFPQEIVGWPTSNSRYSYIELTLRKTNALSTQTTSSFSLPRHRSTKRDHASRP